MSQLTTTLHRGYNSKFSNLLCQGNLRRTHRRYKLNEAHAFYIASYLSPTPTFSLQQSQHPLTFLLVFLLSEKHLHLPMQAGGTRGGMEPNMTTVKKVRIFQCSVGEPYTSTTACDKEPPPTHLDKKCGSSVPGSIIKTA
jgi:hypothetical protein